MSDISLTNTTAQLSGKTVPTAEGDYTITGQHTFDRDPSAPFVVTANSAAVTNLDADKLDGIEGAAFLLKAGGTMTGDLLFTDATYDVGKTGATRPRDGFFSRNVVVGGTFTPTGNVVSDLLFTDATYDIGKSAATRPRDGFFSRNVTVGGTLTAPGVPVLLYANSGTNAAAGATNVDSIAITGLTAKDSLWILGSCESVTQQTAGVQMYNATDGVQISQLANSNTALAAGGYIAIDCKIRQRQTSSVKILGWNTGFDSMSAINGTNTDNNPTFTTAWTGNWTLALRHTGVTAGGTFAYSWVVYKIPGQ